ncbi:MAG: hypothetical protein V3W41_06875 [Planctomycetota bacterium]
MFSLALVCALFSAGVQNDASPSDYLRAQEIFANSSRPIENLRTHTQTFPRDPWGHHFLSSAFRDLGDLDSALKSAERAIELDAKQSLNWGLKGAILGSQNHHRAAVDAFRRAASLDDREDVIQHYRTQTKNAEQYLDSAAGLQKRSWIALTAGLLIAISLAFWLRRI